MPAVTRAPSRVPLPSRSRGYVSPRLIPPLLTAAGLVVYAAILRVGPLEALRSLAGTVVLWGPFAALTFAWLRDEMPDRLPRATFAAIAGYALTTLLYFLCRVVAGPWLFYLLQVVIVAAAFKVWRRAPLHPAEPADPDDRGSGWILALLIVVSLLILSRYQVAERVDPATGDVRFLGFVDQTYFAGQSYELARHTPPVQQACQAGAPERAYHLLPHLAGMLTAKFTGQPDMMRAHLVYHYATITVLLCLALYSIAWRVSGLRVAGYAAVSFLAILAIPLPPMSPTQLGYHYFNLFPLATSVFGPTVLTSPQMYSGLVPAFGVLLGVVYVCHALRNGRDFGRVAIVCAAMVAALSRFRVQVFLPMAPGFMLLLAYLWWRARGRDRRLVFVAALVTAVLSSLLYFETRRSAYLPQTASLQVGFYPNYRTWMNDWPGATAVVRPLVALLGPDRIANVWVVIVIVGFTLLNEIGIPSLMAAAAWLPRRRTWREWGPYAGLTLWLIAASVVGALTVRVGYDDYSVGGQMLLHTGWYALPILGIAVGLLIAWVQRRTHLPRIAWVASGAVVIAAAGIAQAVRPQSALELAIAKQSLLLPRNDWLAIQFIHDHLPTDAVILSNVHLEPEHAVYPGLAGRAAYLSYVGGAVNILPPDGRQPALVRLKTINDLYAERDPARFASLLASTGATHLVEFSEHPLKIVPPDSLRLVWDSPASPPGAVRVRIFQVVTPPVRPATAPSEVHTR